MSDASRQQSCEDRIARHLCSRIEDLRRLWTAWCAGNEGDDESLHEYGLSFDYVPPETFDGQKEAYFRCQLSWGGSSDEFRFFVNPDLSLHRVEYWFLDWFDGAHRVLDGKDESLLCELWEWFRECGAAEHAMKEAA